ncbi:ABC transporter ATP-binding protein [Amaricoccus macauensis]|uniref:ABC transporter ATP-binding protein n=1 Tax=Amaricoccus macauensis TaxID=57001 RepID=UPI003C7D192D
MDPIVSVENVRKTYEGGFEALKGADLQISQGEILALLGPNGAGKTTLISMICGIAEISSGRILVGGHDVAREFREARQLIGLVPQEISIDPFEKVLRAVRFSRGLFGLPPNEAFLERILRDLSLWDKRDAATRELSGGMKRRVMIAKALAHEPKVLFLDEPSAGVDVELRTSMWETVRQLQKAGTTIILTTHYIEEAEAIADRVGVINQGRILLVEEKAKLLDRMGRKELTISFHEPVFDVPAALGEYNLERTPDGTGLIYSYDRTAERTGITSLLKDLSAHGLVLRDIQTRQSSLEDIFVHLVKESA